jgi:hypothetical protein
MALAGPGAAQPPHAKLPAPVLDDEAKAKAAEAKAKTAHRNKVDATSCVCRWTGTVAHYQDARRRRPDQAAGHTPPCVDPGAFVAGRRRPCRLRRKSPDGDVDRTSRTGLQAGPSFRRRILAA